MQGFFRATVLSFMLGMYTISVDALEQTTNDSVVSVGGSVTEILFALGANEQIVATDTSSSFPVEAQKLPKVGYYRQLSAEGVLSRAPSEVYAVQGAGPNQVLEQIRNAGVQVHIFEQARTVDGLLSLIRQVGKVANLEANADKISKQVEQALLDIHSIRQASEKRVVFLMSANDRGLMAAGKNTVPNLIMEIAGLENPYHMIEGFQPISVESFLAVNPTHVLIASHRTGGMSASQLCKQAALQQWASTQGCNLYSVDPLLFLGMTPRLPQAVEQLANLVSAETYARSE